MQIKLALNGKEINLTSDNTIIKSNNFNVDKNGNMSCTNANISGTISSSDANITGGKIVLNTSLLYHYDTFIVNDSEHGSQSGIGASVAVIGQSGSDTNSGVQIFGRVSGGGASHVYADDFSNGSLKEFKKNFEKLENGLDIIKATDIYKYNLKTQTDETKKSIGFVIGEGYNHSSEITSLDKDGKEAGANIYSMVSVSYKAIQEQQEMIEQLQEKDKQKDREIDKLIKRIETLEKEEKNGNN